MIYSFLIPPQLPEPYSSEGRDYVIGEDSYSFAWIACEGFADRGNDFAIITPNHINVSSARGDIQITLSGDRTIIGTW